MRAAFFVLLLANLAYLAWAEWIDVPQRSAANDVYAKLPRLQLVSETAGGDKHPSSGSPRRTVLQQPQQASRCVTVGPFYDEAGATRVTSLLYDKGLAPRQRSQDGDVPKGFWVYIGGLKTDHDVSQVLRLLEQSHVDDARAMPDEGADTRRVSVGIFTDRDRADRRAQSLQKLGLQPEVAERKTPGRLFWVDADLPPGAASLAPQDLTAEDGKQPPVTPCPAGGPSRGAAPLAPAPSPSAPFRTKVAGASQVP